MTVISEEVPQYEIKCRLTYIATVIVEARSQEEAIEKFEAADWIDDGMGGAEMVDCEMIGKPRK